MRFEIFTLLSLVALALASDSPYDNDSNVPESLVVPAGLPATKAECVAKYCKVNLDDWPCGLPLAVSDTYRECMAKVNAENPCNICSSYSTEAELGMWE